MSTESEPVAPETLVEYDNGLVIVTFNRPHRKNAMNGQSWDALDVVLAEVESNPEHRALLLMGADGNFGSGADLSGGLDSGGGGERPVGSGALRGQQSTLHEMRSVGLIIARLQRMPKPTVAAVDGVAIGVSLGLALACDLIVASDRARFCEIFVKRGLGLDGGASWSLPRQVGLRRAKQMAFFGDMIDATQAERWGLVNEVVAPELLAETARAWATRLAAGPTTALSLIKRMLDSSYGSSFEEALEDEARVQQVVFTTKDMREGMTAFIERREPRFEGI